MTLNWKVSPGYCTCIHLRKSIVTMKGSSADVWRVVFASSDPGPESRVSETGEIEFLSKAANSVRAHDLDLQMQVYVEGKLTASSGFL